MNINLTLIGQLISFAIFVWFYMKFVWPPLQKSMHEREQKIAEGLSASDRADKELAAAKQEAERILRGARDETSKIIEQARIRSNRLIEEAQEKARAEGDRIIEEARNVVAQESEKARRDLRSHVAALAVAGAERILEASVDEQKHSDLLDKLAAEL